jgi:HPr kinase/phosphorylase
MRDRLYATTITLFGKAVLIEGASNSGKSSVALSLIQQFGATLLSDDYTTLCLENNALIALGQDGKLEVRGVGIIDVPYTSQAPVLGVISLEPLATIERLPHLHTKNIAGIAVPCCMLPADHYLTPLRVYTVAQLWHKHDSLSLQDSLAQGTLPRSTS